MSVRLGGKNLLIRIKNMGNIMTKLISSNAWINSTNLQGHLLDSNPLFLFSRIFTPGRGGWDPIPSNPT